MTATDRHWHVVQTVDVDASADEVWKVVGGFCRIHSWHPDIGSTAVVPDQTDQQLILRFLTFPGPPESTTTEALDFLDNAGRVYGYHAHAGKWGEMVKEYHSQIRVIETGAMRCLVQWQGEFFYTADAVSDFYRRGLDAVAERF
jgi:hypothetical protein